MKLATKHIEPNLSSREGSLASYLLLYMEHLNKLVDLILSIEHLN